MLARTWPTDSMALCAMIMLLAHLLYISLTAVERPPRRLAAPRSSVPLCAGDGVKPAKRRRSDRAETQHRAAGSSEGPMDYLTICAVAFLASVLTFFSGFGLGTLLLPAFAIFYPVEQAVVATAIVHFINGSFKVALTARYIDRAILLRFGVLSIVGAVAGAWTLLLLTRHPPLLVYEVAGRVASITAPKLVIGSLLLAFVCAELLPRFRTLAVSPRYMGAGGLISGFFGGLAGMQGALRSAFLTKAGLSKQSYIATGAAIAFLIDLSRLGVYGRMVADTGEALNRPLLAAAVASALAGLVVGNRLLRKLTMRHIQATVAVMLSLIGAGLVCGFL